MREFRGITILSVISLYWSNNVMAFFKNNSALEGSTLISDIMFMDRQCSSNFLDFVERIIFLSLENKTLSSNLVTVGRKRVFVLLLSIIHPCSNKMQNRKLYISWIYSRGKILFDLLLSAGTAIQSLPT